jgi:predicted dehydrogenase
MDHVLEARPEAVVATGARHVNGVADLAFVTVYFPGDVVAHLNLSWLSPVKVRTTLIGGRNKMLVWNDLEPDEKIRVYDKGVHISDGESAVDAAFSYRSGDVWVPRVQQTEALKLELEYFAECIINKRRPINDGEAGLRIVRLLEAADHSLKNKGKIVSL